MIEITPKQFQLDALACLSKFLSDATLRSEAGIADAPASAFRLHAKTHGHLPPDYRPLRGMEEAPSVCLRVPTGGGKTILGAMAIKRMADALGVDVPLVLWLTPGKDIRSQTLRALSDTNHPYRQALWNDWGNRVRVYDIADFANITPQDLRSNLCIIVCTRQALQVENTEGRKVYADNENLESHFTSAALATPGLEMADPEGPFAGRPRYSFVNLLKVHRPLVIVDEAHQFITTLASEVKERIGPRALLELTATPDAHSNVLFTVTATQLKQDELIKLPVVLAEHTGAWQTAVAEAVATRKRLADLAQQEAPDYLRPLLLIQAQDVSQPGNWMAVKQYLLDTEQLTPNEIAVHTGDVRELDGKDLFSESEPITTIITVQALKEGWDCSFAYVLCSVANISSARDVEQLLGRVLRMPYARTRKNADLNKAYVHAATDRFHTTADAVRESLHGMGFEEYEAARAIESQQGDLPLLTEPFKLTLFAAPDLSAIPPAEAASIDVQPAANGQFTLAVYAEVTPAILEVVLQQVPSAQHEAIAAKVHEHNKQWQESPAQRGDIFAVPRLTVEVEGGQRLPFDDDILEEFVELDLRQHPEDLRAFSYEQTTRHYLVDISGETLTLNLMGEVREQESSLSLLPSSRNRVSLAVWLAARLKDNRINASMLDAWILHALEQVELRGDSLDILHRARFVLLRLLGDSLDSIRNQARKVAFQAALFAPGSSALATDEFAFRFPKSYAANSWCKANFQKHFYRRPGEMKDTGEEYRCAVEIDSLPEVKYWVRNLAGPAHINDSFWLQTWTQRFYPDFVALLDDGRVLVVEYKGDHLNDAPRERHKLEVGQLWAERSGGRGIFLWALERDKNGRDIRTQLRDAIAINGQQIGWLGT